MNEGQFFGLGEDGEWQEIGEIKEIDTLPPSDLDEQLEKTKEAWRHVGEQITLVIENKSSTRH